MTVNESETKLNFSDAIDSARRKIAGVGISSLAVLSVSLVEGAKTANAEMPQTEECYPVYDYVTLENGNEMLVIVGEECFDDGGETPPPDNTSPPSEGGGGNSSGGGGGNSSGGESSSGGGSQGGGNSGGESSGGSSGESSDQSSDQSSEEGSSSNDRRSSSGNQVSVDNRSWEEKFRDNNPDLCLESPMVPVLEMSSAQLIEFADSYPEGPETAVDLPERPDLWDAEYATALLTINAKTDEELRLANLFRVGCAGMMEPISLPEWVGRGGNPADFEQYVDDNDSMPVVAQLEVQDPGNGLAMSSEMQRIIQDFASASQNELFAGDDAQRDSYTAGNLTLEQVTSSE